MTKVEKLRKAMISTAVSYNIEMGCGEKSEQWGQEEVDELIAAVDAEAFARGVAEGKRASVN